MEKPNTSNWNTGLGRHLISAMFLSILFVIAWIFGLIGTSLLSDDLEDLTIAAQYIFSIFIGLHAVFLLIFHAIRSPESREQWKMWFYVLTCRQAQYNVAHATSLSGTSTTRRFTYNTSQPTDKTPFTPKTLDDPATQAAMEENTIGFDNPAYEATEKINLAKEDGDKDKATKL